MNQLKEYRNRGDFEGALKTFKSALLSDKTLKTSNLMISFCASHGKTKVVQVQSKTETQKHAPA